MSIPEIISISKYPSSFWILLSFFTPFPLYVHSHHSIDIISWITVDNSITIK